MSGRSSAGDRPGLEPPAARSEGEIFSFSAWETAEQADAANIAVADWVAENLAGDVQLTESRFGEILISTTLGITTTAGARV